LDVLAASGQHGAQAHHRKSGNHDPSGLKSCFGPAFAASGVQSSRDFVFSLR